MGDLDQLVAYIANSQAPSAFLTEKILSEYEGKVTRGTANNSPFPYKSSRQVPLQNETGQIVHTAYKVEYSEKVSEKIARWAAKQTLALWFEHTEKIASHRATVDVKILTNTTKPSEKMQNIIRNMGEAHSLSTSRNSTDEQFFYKVQIDPPEKRGIFFAQYHGGFAFFSILRDSRTAKLSRVGLDHKFTTNSHRGIHKLR